MADTGYKMKNAMLPRIRGKKGVNDISIIAILIFIFFGTAIMIPFINSAFGTTSSTLDTDGLAADIQQDAESINTLSAFGVLKTVLLLAFFDFGGALGMPFWLQGIYTILGIILILVIARNIWIGGGG